MTGKSMLWYKLLALFLVLTLALIMLIACGDGGDSEEETPPFTTMATTETSEIPVEKEPVNIGAIVSWSGAAALAGLLADDEFTSFDRFGAPLD